MSKSQKREESTKSTEQPAVIENCKKSESAKQEVRVACNEAYGEIDAKVAIEFEKIKISYPNSELGIGLDVFKSKSVRMAIGEVLEGKLKRESKDHYSFSENASEKKSKSKGKRTPRNPHVFEGAFVNVNRKPDGTLYPTFKRPRFTKHFTLTYFCLNAAYDLILAAYLFEDLSAE